nr:hypothetical protein [Tanacetum cinerariifolium]
NLRITLRYVGRLQHIDTPLRNPPTIDATPEHAATYHTSFVENEKTALLMLACMPPELQKDMDDRTAFDMVNELINMFQNQASQETYDTQRQLYVCKMEDGQLGSSHVLKMKSYIDKL